MVLMRYDRGSKDVFRARGFPNNLKVRYVVKLVMRVCYVPVVERLMMLREALLLFP